VKLYGVGVGPGDPELLTLKGKRLIEAADVVFAPSGRGDHGLSLDIVRAHVDAARQEVVPLPFPIVRDPDTLDGVWSANADTVAARLAGRSTGVFLVEGDPSLYGSFNHLRRALAARHRQECCETVPGVPSIAAAAAVAGVPLAARDERVAVLPASAGRDVLRDALSTFETVVLMKVAMEIDTVLDALAETGRTADALWVQRAGMTGQRIERDVRALRGAKPDYFSLMMVRKHGNT
jgi:precorrin-2/cobalt-factor-2 C20-methyltransferase